MSTHPDSAASTPTSSTRTLVFMAYEDHDNLVGLLDLLTSFCHGRPNAMPRVWSAVQTRLRSHMDLEETVVLPEFAAIDRREVAALIEEHIGIRTLLAELDARISSERIADLAALLETHSERENVLMRRWVLENGRSRRRS